MINCLSHVIHWLEVQKEQNDYINIPHREIEGSHIVQGQIYICICAPI